MDLEGGEDIGWVAEGWEDGVETRQRNCRERWLLGGDEECVEGFVDFDVAGKGVVSGALAGEGVDVGEVFESFYRI